jgi:preprotein translocase subunit SecB
MASDTTDTDTGAGEAATALSEARKSLPLYFSLQFIKDLSFENPRAPDIYENFQEPQVNINVNVGARNIGGRNFEVTLRLSIDAQSGGETSFLVELDYCGIAHVSDEVEEPDVQPMVLIEGPRMLFPFARAIIANLTRDAAYPLLLLGQMDFVEMYRAGIQQAQRGKA